MAEASVSRPVAGPSYIVATAGHVDHGKSTLVKALTGIDPDRLPEEKARGITIDLGFAYLRLPGGASDIHVGIVDVPGHEDFVKNMVAGVGAIDAALLVVAADDGWMPQTEEHLQILTYLKVTRGVVALTKADLPGVRPAEAIENIRLALSASPLAEAPVVPVSALAGEGMEALKAALSAVLRRTPAPRDLGKPRLSIDRVFTLAGIGSIATGSLVGGMLRRGQAVVIQPLGKHARIRSLQSFNRDVEASFPGMRTAVNLPDVPLAKAGLGEAGLERGQVITIAPLTPAKTLDVLLERSERLKGQAGPRAKPLKNGALVRLHGGASHSAARLHLLERTALEAAEVGLARLALEEPLCLVAGDRFVVRDWPEQNTLAGGLVLDAEPGRWTLRDEAQRQLLARRRAAPGSVDVFAHTQVVRERAVRRNDLLVKSSFSAVEIEEASARLVGQREAHVAGDWIVAASWWRELVGGAAAMIAAEHQAHPDRPGLQINTLRQNLDLPSPELFDALVEDLCRADFIQQGVFLRQGRHTPALPPNLQPAGQRLRSALAAKPLDPPSRKELAPDELSRQALRFLVQTGEATELGEDVVLLSEHFRAAREAVKQFLRTRGPATVSDLRQAVGSSRRIVVPLLERMDKDGITVRQGDRRVLKT